MGSAVGQVVRDPKNKVLLAIMHQLENTKPVKRGSCQGKLGDVKLNPAKNVKLLCKQGFLKDALEIMRTMEKRMDFSIYVYLLQGCAKVKALSEGKLVHAHMYETGFLPDRFVWNTLLNMYAKCKCFLDARKVFDLMPERDAFSWSVMIAAYGKLGAAEASVKLFDEMQRIGIQPNQFTFASVVAACAVLEDLKRGMRIHDEIVRLGFQSDTFVASALLDMYSKCGWLEKAREVFDNMSQRDVVSWTAMIAGYAQNGFLDSALSLFEKMPEPNMVSWNTMISGLTQNGCVEEALILFEKMPQRNVVSWTTMIAGFVQSGNSMEALEFFKQMQQVGVKPDSKTFSSVLPACANLAALEQGMEIHQEIIKIGNQSDVFLENALVDMYAKCGSLERAREVFDKMCEQNTVSWTVMISGYAIHGCAQEALKLFEQMEQFGMWPDHVTLLCVLSACCHAGLVNEGRYHFNRMCHYYCITPAMEHYSCMVDLLGRAGYLEEAQDFINRMPIKPDSTVWGCLLGACRLHNNVELGQCVAEWLFQLDPNNAAPYVLLANIYAGAGRWKEIQNLRKIMKYRKMKKIPGCSWIEVSKKVHAFIVGDGYFPMNDTLS